jgi:hypothetical protein
MYTIYIMASTGVTTNNRSMNGIISFDDGNGGLLENGKLTAQHSDTDTGSVTDLIIENTLTLQGNTIANATTITPVWVSYLYGLTSNIQSQINSILASAFGSNNTWTGTNTFNNTVAINSTLSVSGAITGPTITSKQDVITSANRLGADLIGTGIVSTTEYNYLDGVTSAIQSQINSANTSIATKQDTITSANRISADLIGTGIVSTTEYNYLDGVTSGIQGQLNAKQATISSSNRVDAANVGTGIVSNAEFNYLDGVTSGIQGQINSINTNIAGKQDTITTSNRLDAALVGTGVVSNTEYNCLDGVTSSIQTQLDGKASTSSPTITGTMTCADINASGHVYGTDGGFTTLSATGETTLGYPIYWGSQTEKLTGPTTKSYTTYIPNVILCQGSGTINITMPKNSHTQLIILDNVNVAVSKQTSDLNFSSFVNVANVSTSSSPKTFSSTAVVNLYYITNGVNTYIYWAKPTLNTTP